MRRFFRALGLASLSFLLFLSPHLPAAAGQDPVLAIRGAKIFTVGKGIIEEGCVLVVKGKITAVGPVGDVKIPEGALVREAKGLVLIPGLVDTHSHLGVYPRPGVMANADGNEMTGPVQSLVRARDSLFPMDPAIRAATAGGITTANVMPGSGNVMGGQTAYVKLTGETVEDMLIDLAGGPGGMKMANGENPKRSYGRRNAAPATRMKIMALQREIFLKAQEYQAKWKAYEAALAKGEKARKPGRDLALEPVVEILERKRTVHFHTHRADDILSCLRLSEEFGFELVLHHVTEAFEVVKQIAARKVPVSLILLDSPGGKFEARQLSFFNAGICEKAGLKIAIHSDDPVTESRFFLRSGAFAVRGGMSREGALRALTLGGAEMMHLQKRVGSIEVGKDGDLVLLSGDPFSVYTKVLATWIEGKLVFERNRADDYRHATGGFHRRHRLPRTAPPEIKPPKDVPTGAATVPQGLAGDFTLHAGLLLTGDGRSLRDVWVTVTGGRIAHIGQKEPEDLPGGIAVVKAPVVTPGFIDGAGSVGLSGLLNIRADQDQDEDTEPNQAGLRVLDGFNPKEPLLRHLLSQGVVLVQCVPGPMNPIAGQAGIFRTYGETAEEMAVRVPSALVFNLGEAPKRAYGERNRAPGTRMGIAALIRRSLVDAGNEPDEEEGEGNGEGKALNRKALRLALSGEIPALFRAHREDDILTALRIAREFKLKTVLSQATEGYLVRKVLAKAGVPVICGPTMMRPRSLETLNTCLEAPALLAESGIPLAMSSGFEGYVPKTRVVPFEAAIAAAYGLGHDRAIRALCGDAATILGIEKDWGTIAKGKVATFVLFGGDPLEYTTRVEAVIAEGKVVYRKDP